MTLDIDLAAVNVKSWPALEDAPSTSTSTGRLKGNDRKAAKEQEKKKMELPLDLKTAVLVDAAHWLMQHCEVEREGTAGISLAEFGR
jgi:hypothetical protein